MPVSCMTALLSILLLSSYAPGVFSATTLRVRGGSDQYRGYLEVRHNGQWGTVCDYYFEENEAQVACKQLGFSGSAYRAVPIVGGYYGTGSGEIWLNKLRCSGSETRLEDCGHLPWGDKTKCSHSDDVGVFCMKLLSPPPAFKHRLVGGTGKKGRLEVRYNNEWGTVCRREFGDKDAQVACRALSLSGGTALPLDMNGAGSGIIWMDKLACTGTESSLEDCPHEGFGKGSCNHYGDIWISCN